MAEEMEVIQAYNVYKDRDPFDPMEAFDYILDQWFKNELFKYTESKKAALGRLLEVLKNSYCAEVVIHFVLEEPSVRFPISREDELSQLIYSAEMDDDFKKGMKIGIGIGIGMTGGFLVSFTIVLFTKGES